MTLISIVVDGIFILNMYFFIYFIYIFFFSREQKILLQEVTFK